MFLRGYTRRKDGKTHTYYALVESVRTDAGPRQRVVAYLGELNTDRRRRWQRTLVVYNRHGDARQLRLFPDDDMIPLPDDPDVVRIRLSSVGWTNPRSFGDVWLGRWLWGLLHLDQILAKHLPQGKQTVAPADIVAIEVINRLCGPCSEFALAEQWYASTGLEDLLGVPDGEVTKDRLYRTLNALIEAQEHIENDLQKRLGELFELDYDLLLYDLTSTYFEGSAAANELAKRGYSRDHRSDCVQVVLALVVTREGFPLAHRTFSGNTQDLQTVEQIVTAIETRFGKSQRVWVMDRGMVSQQTLKFLSQPGRRYLVALRRSEVKRFSTELRSPGWQSVEGDPEVQVKLVQRPEASYLLSRSRPRRRKERAIRRHQRHGLRDALRRLQRRIATGRLKDRDKILEQVGRLKERFPKARLFVKIRVTAKPVQIQWSWNVSKYRIALAGDGVSLMRTNQGGWTPAVYRETYLQLTVVENAFRVLKTHLRLRPVWHQYSGRTKAHIFICVLAYALWTTLAHLARQAGLMTQIRKPDTESGEAAPQPRPMTPEVILRELGKIKIGDILLETTEGVQLALRRVARPDAEQARILAALKLQLPERLSPDRICSEDPVP